MVNSLGNTYYIKKNSISFKEPSLVLGKTTSVETIDPIYDRVFLLKKLAISKKNIFIEFARYKLY